MRAGWTVFRSIVETLGAALRVLLAPSALHQECSFHPNSLRILDLIYKKCIRYSIYGF